MEKQFSWQGIDESGKKRHGILLATTPELLKQKLLDKRIALLDAKELTRWRIRKKIIGKRCGAEIMYFFSGLSSLLGSGIDLLQALNVLCNRLHMKRIKGVTETIMEDVRCGISFADALERHAIFSKTALAVIRLGEAAGELEKSCDNLTKDLLWHKKFSQKIKRAIFLPTLTLSFALMIIFLILAFVIPRFEVLLGSLNKPLPYVTEIIFKVSRNLVSVKMLAFLLTLLFLGICIRFLVRGRELAFKVPIISHLIYLSDVIRFVNSLAMLLNCSMPLVAAIRYTGIVIKSPFWKNKVESVAHLVESGVSLEVALVDTGGFPEELVAIVAVGERSGNLSFMLSKVASLFEEDLDKVFYFLISVLQPVLMIVVGLIIAFLMLAVYIPIFTITSGL